MKRSACLLAVLAMTGAAWADPVKLTPANPQPSGLTQGLAVSYGFGSGGRNLAETSKTLSNAKAGKPLMGLSYLEGSDGEETLTSGTDHKVAAAISGYIKFDAAGTYNLQFYSNDGLKASIGGQQVVFHDGVHGCDPSEITQVEVPSAGWYALEATYFQRKGGACLMMDWAQGGGELEPVPDEAFAFGG